MTQLHKIYRSAVINIMIEGLSASYVTCDETFENSPSETQMPTGAPQRRSVLCCLI